MSGMAGIPKTDDSRFDELFDLYPWVRPLAAKEVPCQSDPSLFFQEQAKLVDKAKALCQGCPVKDECLRGALEREEQAGVWGGELFVRGIPVPYSQRSKHSFTAEETRLRREAIERRLRDL